MVIDKITAVLDEIDVLYKDFFTWLAGQYDKNTGGFYYAASSKTSDEFKPDIESTAQALHILSNAGLFKKMPAKMKKKLIGFFQERQDPATGYFYDPQNEMKKVDRMVGRAAAYSSGALRTLGSKPLYPLPGSKGSETLPEHLKTEERLIKWLHERDWNYSWMACDNISATSIYFMSLPAKEQKKFLDIIWDFLTGKQDPDTGMWGDGRPYVKISGAFKLAGFYRRFKKDLPEVDKIYGSLLNALRSDTSEDMCWTRNPVDLLHTILPQLGKISQDDIYEIFGITCKNLKVYLKPDGGFSRHRDESMAIPNNVPLGKGLKEGDMNAGTQALRVRLYCYQIAGLKEKPFTSYTKDFYNKVDL